MATDIKLEDAYVVVEGPLKIRGNDVLLDAGLERRPKDRDLTRPRRALVHDFNDGLTINYARDYPGGVRILGPVDAPDGLSVTKLSLNLQTGTKFVKREPIQASGFEPVFERVDLGEEIMALRNAVSELRSQLDAVLPMLQQAQAEWAWCKKCKSLFFKPHTGTSVCAGGGQHDGTGSGNYILPHRAG